MKVSSPDYRGIELDDAVFDFKKRIESMKCEYETIDEERDRDLSFIKIFNQGEKYLVNRVQGKLSCQQCCVDINLNRFNNIYVLIHLG